jgi:hypothetical protein
MHYYTTDLKYKTVMARNIQRVNAVASAAIGLSIAVRARGLARGNIGQNPLPSAVGARKTRLPQPWMAL